jgi:iron complex outermembrane receptor protein
MCALGIFALLAVAGRSRAQSIVGTVQSDHEAVVGATVRVLELDRVTRTGDRGQFAFTDIPTGTFRVFVTLSGYASASRIVTVGKSAVTASFDLVPSAIPLKDIIVSASPVARTANELFQSTESRSQIDFLNSPGSSFAEKLSDIPGVTVRSNGSAPSRPILRGLSDNELLVLENGLRTGDLASFDPAHATPLEAIAISRIEVVRGPATILYGPSTIGGVVNVITNMVPAVSDRPVSGTVALEGNSVSDQSAGYLNTELSSGNQAVRFSVGGVHAQSTRIPAGTYTDPGTGAAFRLDRLPQTFDRSGEVGAGYAYQGALGTFGLGAKHYEMNYGIPGVPPNPEFLEVPPTTSRITQNRNTLELRSLLSGDGSIVNQWKLNASYNDYTQSEFPTVQDETGVSEPQANHFHKRELNAVLQLQHHPIGQLEGTVGLWTNIENLSIEGDEPLGPNSLTSGVAAYVYEEYHATSSTRLQGAVRFDYNRIQTHPNAGSTDSVFQTLNVSRLSNAVTASLGAVQQLTPQVTASFSIARSFRAPTVQELFANGLDAASGTFSIGTASLGPETGFGVDATLRGTFDHASFELSPYINTINHYIYGFLRGDTIQDFPVRQFAATNARLMGGEASVSVEPVTHFALRASTSYVHAENTNRHVPLPFIPPLHGSLRGTYQDRRYMGMAEWRFAASQTRLGDGDTPTSGYGLLNLGGGVRYVERGLVHNISLHCDNVFNRVYRDHVSVIKDFLPQPARGFRLNYELLY